MHNGKIGQVSSIVYIYVLIKAEAVQDLNLRIEKILKKTPMQEEDRVQLLEAVDTAAGKVVNKMIFGLRDSLNQEAFLECVAGLEKVYEE